MDVDTTRRQISQYNSCAQSLTSPLVTLYHYAGLTGRTKRAIEQLVVKGRLEVPILQFRGPHSTRWISMLDVEAAIDAARVAGIESARSNQQAWHAHLKALKADRARAALSRGQQYAVCQEVSV